MLRTSSRGFAGGVGASDWTSITGAALQDEKPSTPYLPRVATPGYPQPSCWGPRGPPSRLRRLTLGVPIEPRAESAGSQLPTLSHGRAGSSSSSSRPNSKRAKEENFLNCMAAPSLLPRSQSREKFRPASWRVLRWPRQLPPYSGAAETSKRAFRGCGFGALTHDPSTSSLGTSACTFQSARASSAAGSTKAARSQNLGELRRVLREEFSSCKTPREVEKTCNSAARIASAGTSEQFGLTGRLAVRLRDVTKRMRDSSFAALEGRYSLALRKTLARESQRRLAELAAAPVGTTTEFFSKIGAGDGANPCGTMLLPMGASAQNSARTLFSPCTVTEQRATSKSAVDASIDGMEPHNLAHTLMSVADRIARDGHLSLIELQAFLGRGTDAYRHFGKFTDWLLSSHAKHFRRFDMDGNGTIETSELEDAIRAFVTEVWGVKLVDKPFGATAGAKSAARPKSGKMSRASTGGRRTGSPLGTASQSYSGTLEVVEEKKVSSGNSDAGSESFNTGDDEMAWGRAFEKCKDDGEVHRDDLAKVLELSSFSDPDAKCIEEAVAKVTQFATLKVDEYFRFVREYMKAVDQVYREAFKRLDADNSGAVDVHELGQLLLELGIEPMQHVLKEVIEEVDDDGTGTLDYTEFTKVINLIKTREGFSRHEFEDFMDLFQKYDRDKSGEIDAHELAGLLKFLGYTVEQRRLEALVKEVDCDDTGQLRQREYLTCMRKVREFEVRKIKAEIIKHDEDGSGTLSLKEAEGALVALGFLHVETQAVAEAATAAGFAVQGCELDVSDFWKFLTAFRQREGFTIADTVEIEGAFRRYDKAKTGEVNVLELGKMLRYLGYIVPYEVQKQLVAQVDLDGSKRVSLPELLKLIRMLQEDELDEAHETFHRFDENDVGYLTVEQARQAFKELGCSDARKFFPEADYRLPVTPKQDDQETVAAASPEAPPTSPRRSLLERSSLLSSPAGVTAVAFVRAVINHRRESRAAFRQNTGFSAQEVEELREAFHRYDSDGSGDISNKELVPLIEDVFPSMAHDPAMRPKLIRVVHEADSDGSGTLDFQDFLSLMVQFNDLQQREHSEREERAIEQTCFSQREVEEFRELFVASNSGHGMLSCAEIQKMMGTVCPMGDRNAAELYSILSDVVATFRPFESEVGVTAVSFPEFLLLMHKLLEVDFAGLKERLKKYG